MVDLGRDRPFVLVDGGRELPNAVQPLGFGRAADVADEVVIDDPQVGVVSVLRRLPDHHLQTVELPDRLFLGLSSHPLDAADPGTEGRKEVGADGIDRHLVFGREMVLPVELPDDPSDRAEPVVVRGVYATGGRVDTLLPAVHRCTLS